MSLVPANQVSQTHSVSLGYPARPQPPPSISTSFDSSGPPLIDHHAKIASAKTHTGLCGRPLSTRADRKFTQGMFMFVDVSDDWAGNAASNSPQNLYSLWALNNLLLRYAAAMNIDAASAEVGKRKHPEPVNIPKFDDYTIRGISKRFQYLGVVVSAVDEDVFTTSINAPRKRYYSIQTYGDVNNVGNLWAGDQLCIGDQLGFQIKWKYVRTVMNPSWEEEDRGGQEEGVWAIQIEAVHDDYSGTRVLAEKRADEKLPPENHAARHESPLYIPVGLVHRVNAPVGSTEARAAHITWKGANLLRLHNRTIDIVLKPEK